MAVYPTIALQLKLDGVNWTTITKDPKFPLSAIRGIQGNSPPDRVSSTGVMQFDFDNSQYNSAGKLGYYTPGHANCRTGFATGIATRIIFTYDDLIRPRFKGKIFNLSIDPGTKGNRRTHVEVHDWWEEAYSYNLILPAYATNKTLGQVAALILALMPNQPDSTAYASGGDVFPSVFHTVRNQTTAAAEMQKLVDSEQGYIYTVVGKNGVDETLTTEIRTTRNMKAASQAPLPASLSSKILAEDGSYMLAEDGTYMLSDDTSAFAFQDGIIGLETNQGKDQCARIVATNYPISLGASYEVLYKQGTEIVLLAGASLPLRITYVDPTGGAPRVCGIGVICVSGTDYTMFTATAGGGSNITADLAITYPNGNPGTFDAQPVLTNNNGATGYINLYQLRGYIIRVYNQASSFVETTDATILGKYGKKELSMDFPYQSDANVAYGFITRTLGSYKDPPVRGDTLTYCANISPANMGLFLTAEIGDKLSVYDPQSAINEFYFIQGIQFDVQPGNVIFVKYFIKSASIDTYTGFVLDSSLLNGADLLA